METNLIAILAAVGIAVLASPIMAQPASHPHKGHGSVARANTAPATDDAVHVAFPQQSGSGY